MLFQGRNEIRNMAERKWWTLQRFGLTPGKLVRRTINRAEPRVFCVCVPKAGTHLLERSLCLHPRIYRRLARTVHNQNIEQSGGLASWLDTLKPGQLSMAHLFFSSERLQLIRDRNVKAIFMIRDPRDVVVSNTFFILKRRDHAMHELFAQQPDFKSCLRLAISGDPAASFPSIADDLENYRGWLESGLFTVRFEDLVGPSGGGDKSMQRDLLRSLFEFLGLDADDNALSLQSARLFSNASPTFRKGQIGGWTDHFDAELKELFKQHVGDALFRYGYEQNDRW